MWPFSSAALTPEQKDRCKRKCELAKASLRNCQLANAANPGVCSSLETQVVHCLAEVACPELARQHELCFFRVVNSQGAEPYSACDVHVKKMKTCLRRHGLYPFEQITSAKG